MIRLRFIFILFIAIASATYLATVDEISSPEDWDPEGLTELPAASISIEEEIQSLFRSFSNSNWSAPTESSATSITPENEIQELINCECYDPNELPEPLRMHTGRQYRFAALKVPSYYVPPSYFRNAGKRWGFVHGTSEKYSLDQELLHTNPTLKPSTLYLVTNQPVVENPNQSDGKTHCLQYFFITNEEDIGGYQIQPRYRPDSVISLHSDSGGKIRYANDIGSHIQREGDLCAQAMVVVPLGTRCDLSYERWSNAIDDALLPCTQEKPSYQKSCQRVRDVDDRFVWTTNALKLLADTDMLINTDMVEYDLNYLQEIIDLQNHAITKAEDDFKNNFRREHNALYHVMHAIREDSLWAGLRKIERDGEKDKIQGLADMERAESLLPRWI